MKHLLPILCAAALLAGAAACRDDAPRTTGIIPAPRSVEWQRGSFRMPETLTYAADLAPADRADLQEWCQTAPIRLAPAGEQPPLLRFETDTAVAPEGYRLGIAGDGIRIAASDAAGMFYGLQSLVQIAERFGAELPALTIDDAPRFPYRGLMFDVSRHFRSKEMVMKQLDLMARYKLNRFHWHLTDGAGWRIRIDRYPKLTDMAAWRPYPDWKSWAHGGKHYCLRDEPGAEGGYYTKDDIREVVAHARKLHITVVPEIEMPGHSEEVLAAYPELSCSGKPYDGAFDLCIGNEKSFEFLQNVLDEVMELFPGEYIHIGGDEASKRTWQHCPKCRARMQREGLKDVDELQSYLTRRIERYINSRGRKLLGWDEILDGGLAPNATVMSWRGIEGGIAAATTGHHAIMTPGGYCYLDACQDDPSAEPPSSGAFLALPTVYSYDPAPDSLGAQIVPMILGVQGNLWCEHVKTDEHFERMLWPRGLAIAEVGWSLPENKDYDDFLARTLDAIEWMKARGYHPFEQADAVGSREESREPVRSLSTGKPVAYNTPYHEKYAAAGDAAMTDGLRGGWSFSDGRWQGWLGGDVDLTVDLGGKQPVKYIGIDFLQSRSAEIWMPCEVEFFASDDNEHFERLGSVCSGTAADYDRSAYETFSWTGGAEGRYIRVVGRRNEAVRGWLFTDEVIVE